MKKEVQVYFCFKYINSTLLFEHERKSNKGETMKLKKTKTDFIKTVDTFTY